MMHTEKAANVRLHVCAISGLGRHANLLLVVQSSSQLLALSGALLSFPAALLSFSQNPGHYPALICSRATGPAATLTAYCNPATANLPGCGPKLAIYVTVPDGQANGLAHLTGKLAGYQDTA